MAKKNRTLVRCCSAAAVLTACFALGSCSSNSDEGGVSGDYMKVTDVVMSGNLSSTTLHIDADCSWRISESVDWLTVSPIQGTGSADIELTTGANPSSVDERSCELTVTTDGGVTRTITLTQGRNNESMSVSTHTLSFGEGSGELVFSITSNTRWKITGGADWLTLSTSEGTDNGSVTVIAQANTTEFERTAVYTVTGNSGTAEQVNVTQLGKTVILTIEPELISATAKGRSYSFQVLGNADWTVTADVTTWLELDVRSGSGESPVRVTLSDNVTSEPRTANIHVTSSSGRHERTCVITQAGATVPSLTQPAVSGVERYAASVSSTFTSSLDATQGGFCYALTPNPTINDKSVTVDGVSGQDGQLSATLTDLVSGRTYYVRSWVRNANGIGYSSDANFTTEGKTPGENDNPTPDL